MRTLLLLLLSAPFSAQAFCGFYVSGAGSKLFNDASMPVPVVLSKDTAKTIPREAFTRLDELTAPRLVEMATRSI